MLLLHFLIILTYFIEHEDHFYYRGLILLCQFNRVSLPCTLILVHGYGNRSGPVNDDVHAWIKKVVSKRGSNFDNVFCVLFSF